MRFPLTALLLVGCSTDTFAGPDAMTEDAPMSDSPPPSEASTNDSSTDSGLDGDASGTFSCGIPISTTLLCTTFDTLSSVSPSWTSVGWAGPLAVNGTNSIDTTQYISPPQSYLAMTFADDAGASAFASANLFYQDLSSTHATISARAAVNISALDSSTVQVIAISYQSSLGLVYGSIAALSGMLYLVVGQGSAAPATFPMVSFAVGTWHILELVFTFGTSSVKAYVGGVEVASSSTTLESPNSVERDVSIGIVSATRAAPTTINVDDVLIQGF